MKAINLLLAHLSLALARSTLTTNDRRVLKRSAIKLRSNTGQDGYGSSCSGETCPNTDTLTVFLVIFGIIGVVCVGYCIAACY